MNLNLYKKEMYIIGAIIIVLIIAFMNKQKISTAMSKLTRGLRNNNPGNIRKTSKLWTGEIAGQDKAFKTFVDLAHGYRAIFALLAGRLYIGGGTNTIRKILSRYAPPTENATEKYIATVSKRTGINPDTELSFKRPDELKKVVEAISFVENGVPGDIGEIEKGYKLYIG